MAVVAGRVIIVNETGLHARPAAAVVKLLADFESKILLTKDEMTVNAKSIMGVMTLAAECGSELTVWAEGPDAEAAVKALEALFAGGFKA